MYIILKSCKRHRNILCLKGDTSIAKHQVSENRIKRMIFLLKKKSVSFSLPRLFTASIFLYFLNLIIECQTENRKRTGRQCKIKDLTG